MIYWTDERLVAMRDEHLPKSTTLAEALRRGGHDPRKVRTFREHFKRLTGSLPGALLDCDRPGLPELPDADKIAVLVKMARTTPRPLEEICNALDCAPSEARRLIDLAIDQGTTLKVERGGLTFAGLDPLPPKSLTFPKPQRELCFAVISDTHFGSRYHRGDELGDFIGQAYDAGARTVFDCGDGLDGHGDSYPGHVYDLELQGIEAQTQARLDGLPQLDGLTYYFIDGNHDAAFWKKTGQQTGIAVERAAAERGRDDLRYLGPDVATVYYGGDEPGRGVKVQLRHPDGGTAYALSYKLQRFISGIQSGRKPQIVLSGHHHRYIQLLDRNVHAFEVGCFQSQTPYQARKGITPALGGLIFRVDCAADYSIRRLSATFVPYYGEEVPRS